jgi:hypothetical protein
MMVIDSICKFLFSIISFSPEKSVSKVTTTKKEKITKHQNVSRVHIHVVCLLLLARLASKLQINIIPS